MLQNRTYILLLERSKGEEKKYCERTKVKNKSYLGIVEFYIVKEPRYKMKLPWYRKTQRTKVKSERYFGIEGLHVVKESK